MSKILIFGGTTEGKELAIFAESIGKNVIYHVATAYGMEVLPVFSHVYVRFGRLDEIQIGMMLHKEGITHVLDATHPFAKLVSANIKHACEEGEISYTRVVREFSKLDEGVHVFSTQEEAAFFLNSKYGNILLTTGSKEIVAFKNIDKSRVYARVLPSIEAIEACKEIGIKNAHILALQGPFSKEFNMAMLKEYSCQFLVSKYSGKSGGFEEKLAACKEMGIMMIAIDKPEEDGITLDMAKRYIHMW